MEPPYETGTEHLELTGPASTGNVRVLRASPAGRSWRRWMLGFTPAEVAVAAAVLLVVLAVVAGVVWMVYEFLAWLFGLLGVGADKAVNVGGWLLHGPVTSTVAEPVSRFLHGAPAGEQLWRTWLVALLVLFIAAVRGSRGGRIGWVVLGVATAYMAWRGGGEGAAITTALLWALLSVPAFAGASRDAGVNRPAAPAPGRRHPSGAERDAMASTDAGDNTGS
jgi:hypothetical protein